MYTIGDRLIDRASCDGEQDWEDEEDDQNDTELCRLCENVEPGRVTGIISKMVHQRMAKFRRKQVKHDELMQPQLRDPADYFHETDKTYGTAQLSVPAVVKLQTVEDAAASARETFGQLMKTLDNVPRKVRMLHGTFQPASSPMRLGFWKQQSNICIASLPPGAVCDLLAINHAKPVKS